MLRIDEFRFWLRLMAGNKKIQLTVRVNAGGDLTGSDRMERGGRWCVDCGGLFWVTGFDGGRDWSLSLLTISLTIQRFLIHVQQKRLKKNDMQLCIHLFDFYFLYYVCLIISNFGPINYPGNQLPYVRHIYTWLWMETGVVSLIKELKNIFDLTYWPILKI